MEVENKMFWMGWILIYLPLLLLMFIFKVPEHIFVPVAVGGALILVGWDVFQIFAGFGSSNTFFGQGKKAKTILETGRSATAKVIALDENSGGGVVTINDQPYLNLKLSVDDGKAPPYEVSFDTIIPRSAVPQFQPGASFKVKIDQNNPQTVVIDITQQESFEAPQIVGKGRTEEDDKMIKEQGLSGVAKLLSVEDTGRSENMQPVIKVSWEVKCAKWGTYASSNEFSVSTKAAQQLQTVIGKSFSAKIHPYNRDRMSIDVKF
jgi:hypothetical protein